MLGGPWRSLSKHQTLVQDSIHRRKSWFCTLTCPVSLMASGWDRWFPQKDWNEMVEAEVCTRRAGVLTVFSFQCQAFIYTTVSILASKLVSLMPSRIFNSLCRPLYFHHVWLLCGIGLSEMFDNKLVATQEQLFLFPKRFPNLFSVPLGLESWRWVWLHSVPMLLAKKWLSCMMNRQQHSWCLNVNG